MDTVQERWNRIRELVKTLWAEREEEQNKKKLILAAVVVLLGMGATAVTFRDALEQRSLLYFLRQLADNLLDVWGLAGFCYLFWGVLKFIGSFSDFQEKEFSCKLGWMRQLILTGVVIGASITGKALMQLLFAVQVSRLFAAVLKLLACGFYGVGSSFIYQYLKEKEQEKGWTLTDWQKDRKLLLLYGSLYPAGLVCLLLGICLS